MPRMATEVTERAKMGTEVPGVEASCTMSTYKEQWVHRTGGYCTSDAMPILVHGGNFRGFAEMD